jgi:hypothetical protein
VKERLQKAAMSPLDATDLGLIVSAELPVPPNRRIEGARRPGPEAVAAAQSQKVGLNLEAKQYE